MNTLFSAITPVTVTEDHRITYLFEDDRHYLLALATIDIGSFLFLSRLLRWPRQVLSVSGLHRDKLSLWSSVTGAGVIALNS